MEIAIEDLQGVQSTYQVDPKRSLRRRTPSSASHCLRISLWISVQVSVEIHFVQLTGCISSDCCSVQGIHFPNVLAGDPTLTNAYQLDFVLPCENAHQTIEVFWIIRHGLDALTSSVRTTRKVTLGVLLAIVERRQGFGSNDGQVYGAVAKVDDRVVVVQTPGTIEPVALMPWISKG
jgi:hypothetical protein